MGDSKRLPEMFPTVAGALEQLCECECVCVCVCARARQEYHEGD
jgi:hypothetical protein